MNDNRAIGFMDSGLGGASVLKAALQALPNENFIFYGDNANAPYGDKTPAEIKRLSLNAAQNLIKCNVKLIVVACNTATSAAIVEMRKRFLIPVISMEPAIKPALQYGNGKILMLATQATCNQKRYHQLKKRLSSLYSQERIIDIACSGWVECIEKNLFEPDGCNHVIGKILNPFMHMEIDNIVLGCTHYTLIQNQIKKYLKSNGHDGVNFHDGHQGTILQLINVLQDKNMTADKNNPSTLDIYTSGDEHFFVPIIQKIVVQQSIQ